MTNKEIERDTRAFKIDTKEDIELALDRLHLEIAELREILKYANQRIEYLEDANEGHVFPK